jgi:hypothetical protein
LLLAAAAMMPTACPLPDVPFGDNQPPVLDSAALKPPEGEAQTMDCSADDTREVTFDLGNALEDPDGDSLRVLWYVNYNKDNPTAPDSEDPKSLTMTCFGDLVDGTNVIEAIIMDRPSQGSTAAALRRVEAGGYAIHLVWPITFTGSEGTL